MFSFYLSDSYFWIVDCGLTIAETVLVLFTVDGLILPEANALTPVDGRFFLGDGWISVVTPDFVGWVYSSSSSLSFVFVFSSSEAKCVDAGFGLYLGCDWTVVVVEGLFVGMVCCRGDSSSNLTNLPPDERIGGRFGCCWLLIRSAASLSIVRLSSARIRSKLGKS